MTKFLFTTSRNNLNRTNILAYSLALVSSKNLGILCDNCSFFFIACLLPPSLHFRATDLHKPHLTYYVRLDKVKSSNIKLGQVGLILVKLGSVILQTYTHVYPHFFFTNQPRNSTRKRINSRTFNLPYASTRNLSSFLSTYTVFGGEVVNLTLNPHPLGLGATFHLAPVLQPVQLG